MEGTAHGRHGMGGVGDMVGKGGREGSTRRKETQQSAQAVTGREGGSLFKWARERDEAERSSTNRVPT